MEKNSGKPASSNSRQSSGRIHGDWESFAGSANPAMQLYLRELGTFPKLSPEEQSDLAARILAAENKWVTVAQELTCYRVHDTNLSSPGLAGLGGQAALSRKARQKNSLSRTVELADALIERLPENIPAAVRDNFAAFRKHYFIRSGYSGNFLLRGWQILREIFSLRYRRYSNGWKSVAADLFLFR